jgi:hypothetical protein
MWSWLNPLFMSAIANNLNLERVSYLFKVFEKIAGL